jgi:hypothetical protein
MNQTVPTPLEIGMGLARRLFAKRGNHTEVHLSEAQLAAWLTVAAMKARGEDTTTIEGVQ